MPTNPKPTTAVLVSGTIASLTSVASLAIASRIEGKGALRPLNATSHWLHGEGAADHEKADFAHTCVGYATHLAATVFWAALFEGLIHVRRRSTGSGSLRAAAVTSVVASFVDYEMTPRRFTPGWEFVLTRTSMGAAYAAMAIGLVVGCRLAPSR